jgi:hypothetical protein
MMQRHLSGFATQDDPVRLFAIDINGQGVGGIGIHPQQDVYKKMQNWVIGSLNHSGEKE